MQAVNEKLEKIKGKIALKKILENKLKAIRQELEFEQKKLYELTEKLAKEKKDVEKLQKLSLSSIIASIKGNKDEQLSKENHEYVIAKVKFDEVVRLVKNLEEDIIREEFRLNDLKNIENEYNSLIKEKLEYLKRFSDNNIREELAKKDDKINELVKENKEIEEAKIAGENIIDAIKEAKNTIKSAEDLGVWDIAGGDFLTSMMKQEKIDKANREFEKITYLLSKFNKELKDINISSIEFSSRTIAFDIYFDNIFTDISVQNKIVEAKENIIDIERQVNDLINRLDRDYLSNDREIHVLKEEYSVLIENY